MRNLVGIKTFIGATAEIPNEVRETCTSYGVVDYGNVVSDAGLISVASDTIIYDGDNPISDLTITAAWENDEYEFATATYWCRDTNLDDEGITVVLYYM